MGSASSTCNANPPVPPLLVPEEEYDVFLCFNGETRGGFTSHLVRALNQAGFRTFTDEMLPRGQTISVALLDRIKWSRSTIIVYSEGFAASRWCLDEVVESFRCREEKLEGHYIFPIFYKVDPSELRNLSGKTGYYLYLHDNKYAGKVARWRECLMLLSDIAGWHFTTGGNESALIQIIVEQVAATLRS